MAALPRLPVERAVLVPRDRGPEGSAQLMRLSRGCASHKRRSNMNPCGSDILVRYFSMRLMSRRKKMLVVLAGVLLALVLYSVIRNTRTKAAQRQAEARYLDVLTTYQRELHPGITRARVEEYFKSHRIAFTLIGGGDFGSGSDAVRIGEEPLHTVVCDSAVVYVVFKFADSASEGRKSETSDSDVLRDIKLEKIYRCM
jgi:hypothetical protein